MRCEFEGYISEHLDEIYRFAYIYTHSREAAEEVVGEAIVKALSKIGGLKSPQYMKTWFYRIVINTAHTYAKKQGREALLGDAAFMEYGASDDYSRLDLESLFRCLDAEQRSIVALRFFEDMRLSDIAKTLKMNENTVKTKLYTALNKLRREWD